MNETEQLVLFARKHISPPSALGNPARSGKQSMNRVTVPAVFYKRVRLTKVKVFNNPAIDPTHRSVSSRKMRQGSPTSAGGA
jgi:hypothetical protein